MKVAKRPRILSSSAAALLAIVALHPMPVQATVLTWTGNNGNLWETPPPPGPTNWQPNNITPATDVNDSDLIFTGTKNTNTVNDNAGNTFLQSITFDSAAGKFTLSGTALTMDGGGFIINNSTNLQVISFSDGIGVAGITLNQFNFNSGLNIPLIHWTAAAGDILVTSNVSSSTPMTLVIGGPHDVTITGSFSEISPGFFNLVKEGTGTLWLTDSSHSTYTGDTTVSGGTLRLDGSIASARTFVNPNGTLSGHGYIGGTLYNNGNVAPGDPTGTLTVKGNYFQSAGATLTVELDGKSADQHSLLAVGGQAKLDGELRIVALKKGPRLNVGERVAILTAGGGVQGKFGDVAVISDTLFSGKVIYEANKVEVEGALGSVAALNGLTANQQAVAKGIDKISFRNQQPKLLTFLAYEPISKIPGDLDKIAPEELTSIFTIGTSLANIQTANLQRRTADIRYGSHGFSASGFATAGSGPLYSGGVAGPTGNDGKESKEMKAVVPAEDRWGVFITGVGEWVNVDGDGNARGYDITTGGFTVGADYKVTPNFAIGLMAGYAGTGSDLNNGGRVFVNSGKLGLYATYFTGGFYVDTAVNGGYNSYDTRRDALEGTARGDTDGGELNVLFATGYDFKLGNFTVGPTASFQYTYLGLGDYTEHGSLAPLTFSSQHQESLRTALGMKASYDWKIGGVILRPELRVAWQHEYGDSTPSIDASFENGGGDLFSVSGPQIGRDSLLLGAGIAVLWNERTSTYVYYDGELGRTNYNSHNVSGGMRVSF